MTAHGVKAIVSGKVQGVWFRAFTREQAEKNAVTGWAKNLANGDVEVMLCGDANAIDATLARLKQGPPLARVDSVDCQQLPWRDINGFTTG